MKPEYTWSMYVAASVDILGQKEHFAKMQDFFTLDVSEETRQGVAEHTVFIVNAIRKSLNKLFKESRKDVVAKIAVPEKDREEYDKLCRTSPIEARAFSDCILAFIEVGAADYQMNDWMAVRDIFHSVGGTLLGTLAIESSFRAAIELGIGIILDDGDLYGPIRAKIHELEKSADYPRIVVGRQLYEYMMSFCEGHPRLPIKTQRDAEGSKSLAVSCRNMISQDPNDGQRILDYLGSENLAKIDPAGDFYGRASRYVDDELSRRRLYENDKVFKKFQKLRYYFDLRPHPALTAK